MSFKIDPAKSTKCLTSNQLGTPASARSSELRYDLSNTGPSVQQKAALLVGKAINVATVALRKSLEESPIIASNARPTKNVTPSENSVSGIISAADMFN